MSTRHCAGAIGVALGLAAALVVSAQDLPYIAPQKVAPLSYNVEVLPGGALKVALKDFACVVTSDFSTMPGWAKLDAAQAAGFAKTAVQKTGLTGETDGFTLSRAVVVRDECVEVADTLTNKTAENLPVMVRHSTAIKEVTGYRLGGRKIFLKRGNSADPGNPTVVCMTNAGAVGLIPLDDVFRVHSLSYAANGMYGIADNNLVLKPGAAYTVRFAVFLSPISDYYAVINAMRRFLGVNFTLDGSEASLGPRQPGAKNWKGDQMPDRASSVEYLRNFLTCKSAKYVIIGREERKNGLYLEGPDWPPNADPKLYKDFIAKLKQAVPAIQTSIYFANNFYALEDGKTKYKDSVLLNPDGSQADYRDPKYPLWMAIDGTAYATDLAKTLDFITDTIGTDGVYWDEFEHSAASYHFGQPWDGVSADIDPQTHKISQLKSSVTLLTQPWRVKQVNRILDRKLYLIVNGAPSTETMARIHFIRFTETGSMANCTKMHLYTPLALGDHITEKTETDCYRCMLAALQYGCVYYWYHDQVQPITHKSLTEYMFPVTPVELGEGYLIAKERIVTAKSGWFSFGDVSKAEGRFFNADGVEVQRPLPTAERSGMTYYKVELAENESCSLVRKGGT